MTIVYFQLCLGEFCTHSTLTCALMVCIVTTVPCSNALKPCITIHRILKRMSGEAVALDQRETDATNIRLELCLRCVGVCVPCEHKFSA
ncbi:hypothetical protein GGI42DRAFT_320941 [Trichoderma sp. SZMC 28013]